ncbi:MAG TPA: site-specific integrase [Chthoniobacterales bacterium]
MASLKKVSRSPYWYIRRRDLDTGAWRDENTKFRRDSVQDTRAAQKLADKYSSQENQVAATTRRAEFSVWVHSYLQEHYRTPSTKIRMQMAWQNVSEWLRVSKLRHPQQIRYRHAQEFVDWRKASNAKHNTVRLELKFFSFVLTEAVRREFCERNPWTEVKMERAAVAPKADLTDEMIAAARAGLNGRPSWYRIVFEIMLHTGCRFSESSIPMDRVDFGNLLIWMEDAKRNPNDPRKLFSVPIPQQLADFLAPLKGMERTVPTLNRDYNQRFNTFLTRAIGVTSHSLRVAFISRCHRAGLSESEAMRLVNHSSKMVHMVYTRLNVQDARNARLRVPLPPAPVPLVLPKKS